MEEHQLRQRTIWLTELKLHARDFVRDLDATWDQTGRGGMGCLVDHSDFGNLETVPHRPEVARVTANRQEPVQVVVGDILPVVTYARL